MGRSSRQLAAALDRDEPVLCLCLVQARTPDAVLIAAASGFDAVYVDLEHGVTPLDVTSMLCTAALGAGMIPFVRVPALDAAIITRVLDGGALGLIVPHIDTAEQARALVDMCRFPPIGRRTLYSATPVTGYRPLDADEALATLDRDVVVSPMIESALAVEHADKIAATEGVDLLVVGAHDLSSDLGVPGAVTHPTVTEAIHRVAEACTAHGKHFGLAGVSDAAVLAGFIERGLGFISAGTDAGLLQQAATARVAALRGLATSERDQRT